jgi:hypothetical protein
LTVPDEPAGGRRSYVVTLAVLLLVAGGLTATMVVVGRSGDGGDDTRQTSESQPGSQASVRKAPASAAPTTTGASPAPTSSSPALRRVELRERRQIYAVCAADPTTVVLTARLDLGLTRWSYASDGRALEALTSSGPGASEIVESCGAGRLNLIRLRHELAVGVQRRLGARTLDIVCSSGDRKALDTLPVGSDFACSVSAAAGEAVVVPGTITAAEPHFRLTWPTGREATVLGPAWPGAQISIDLRHDDRRDVAMVQRRLNELGYGPLTVDGHFGVLTEAAVVAFQADQDLDVDGIVGPYTWAALFQ